MRHAKKAVMVPEDEYLALLSMLKGGDYLKNEKALLEGKIRQNLSDPKISQTVKARRHDWLYKKRRQLKEIEENRPQKVVIENAEAVANLAPYLGIKSPKAKIDEEATSTKRVKIKTPRRKLKSANGKVSGTDYNNTGFTTESTASESEEYSTPPKTKMLFRSTQKTLPRNVNQIMSIIQQNPEKYGVTQEGKILTNQGRAIKESNLLENMKYISGQVETPPRGFKFLMAKMNKDPEIAKFFSERSEQSGQGKRRRVVVKIKPIKTPGLLRIPSKKFKPVLWAKL